MASAVAFFVALILVYFFGFKYSDVEKDREVKKSRLGKRDPVRK